MFEKIKNIINNVTNIDTLESRVCMLEHQVDSLERDMSHLQSNTVDECRLADYLDYEVEPLVHEKIDEVNKVIRVLAEKAGILEEIEEVL
jgi:archaellum component FlaC